MEAQLPELIEPELADLRAQVKIVNNDHGTKLLIWQLRLERKLTALNTTVNSLEVSKYTVCHALALDALTLTLGAGHRLTTAHPACDVVWMVDDLSARRRRWTLPCT